MNESNISIYISNNVDIDKASFSKNDKYKDLDCTKIKCLDSEELVIEGLCFIKCGCKTKFEIYLNEGIDVYTRDKIIGSDV